MKDGRDLVSEAVSDAKALREAALAAAKNELLESMAPAIKNLLEKNIKCALEKEEGVNRMRRAMQDEWPGESHTGFEEAKEKGEEKMDKAPEKNDDKDLDLESLAGFFPAVSEAQEEPEGEEEMKEAGIPTLGEGEEEMEEAKKCDDEEEKEEETVDEEIEISESELKKVYEAAMATEAVVTKGFGEMTKSGELDDVVKDVDKGLADVKKGEHQWEKEEPSAKEDFTVKEMIQRGLAENKMLRENLKKAAGMIRALGSKLHEVNLFNAKVMHVNKILNTHGRLTNEQKKVVLESIDKATSIEGVKMVYEAISASFNASASLTESKSRKPTPNAQRPRTSGAVGQKVLSESADKQVSESFNRLQLLAGLTNK